jgi:hypothetical protein
MDGVRMFDQLIGQVDQAATGDDPLSRLEAAVSVGAVVSGQADRLLDHFVEQARRAGHSWTEIGHRLGVSKQAARQRFADRTETSAFQPQLQPRLRACLAQARREAEADGSTEIGTHHLLAGLLAEGVAAAILEKLDVNATAIRDSSHRLFGAPTEPQTASPSMSAEATCALETATHHATTSRGPTERDVVGTEHLLAVLTLDPGSRARRVLNDLHLDIVAIKRELSCHISLNPKPRRRRWWQHRPEATTVCSFCGRPEAVSGRLVAGPGIHICATCVRLAADILDRDDAPTLGS